MLLFLNNPEHIKFVLKMKLKIITNKFNMKKSHFSEIFYSKCHFWCCCTCLRGRRDRRWRRWWWRVRSEVGTWSFPLTTLREGHASLEEKIGRTDKLFRAMFHRNLTHVYGVFVCVCVTKKNKSCLKYFRYGVLE